MSSGSQQTITAATRSGLDQALRTGWLAESSGDAGRNNNKKVTHVVTRRPALPG